MTPKDHRNILYLVNPFSGTGNKEKLKTLIAKETEEQHILFKVENTDAEGNYGHLPQRIISENITDVVICGGDGTVNQVVSQLLQTKVRIGIIPVGSGNGLALGVGIPSNPKKALHLIFQKKIKWIDGFLVNKQFGCMLTGLGFDARVAWSFSKKQKRGLVGYIKICLQEFFKSESYLINIRRNDENIEARIFFISIANSNQFGSHVTIAPEAKQDDGLLDVVLVSKSNPILTGLRLLWQICFGKLIRMEEIHHYKKKIAYWQTSEIEILNPQLAPLHIDGEPKETSDNIHIQLIPLCFALMVP